MLSSLRLELLFRYVCRCSSWNFPGESTVVYKTDVRGIFRVFFLAHVAGQEHNVSTRKKRKRCRKGTKRTDEGTQCLVAGPDALASGCSSSSEHAQGDKPDVLINDHPAGSNANADSESEGVSSPELDLVAR